MTSLTPASPFRRPRSYACTASVAPAAPTPGGAPCAPHDGAPPDTQGKWSEPHGRCSSDPPVNSAPAGASHPAPSLSGLNTLPHHPRASPSPPNQQSLVPGGIREPVRRRGPNPRRVKPHEIHNSAPQCFERTSAAAQAQRSQHNHNRCGHPPRCPKMHPHAKEQHSPANAPLAFQNGGACSTELRPTQMRPRSSRGLSLMGRTRATSTAAHSAGRSPKRPKR